MAAVEKPLMDRAGTGCVILFLLPFAYVGVAMAVMIGSQVWQCWSARSWIERPCTLTRVEMKTHHDEGTTYKVEADYRYDFDGKPFTGNRVWFGSGSDNIGKFQWRVFEELDDHQRQGRPFRCFVDPSDPKSSVLYRGQRYEVLAFEGLFLLVFGGLGGGGIAAITYGCRKIRLMNAERDLYPREPWKWDASSREGVYRPSPRWIRLVLFAVIWSLFSLIFLFSGSLENIKRRPSLDWFLLIIPVIGLIAAWMVLRAVWKRLQYGVPTLTVRPWPLFVGDPIEGTIDFPTERPASPDLNVELSVLRKSTTEDSPDTKLFHETTSISNVDSGAAFRFSSPSGLPRTALLNDETGTPTAKWQIKVTGSNGPADFEAIYELTVFQREARQNQGSQNAENVG